MSCDRENDSYDEQFDEEMRALALMKGNKPKEVIKDDVGEVKRTLMFVGWVGARPESNEDGPSLEGDARSYSGRHSD